MEKEATIKEKQKDTLFNDLDDKLEEVQAKLVFLSESVIGLLEKTDYTDDFKDKVIVGFELQIKSLRDDLEGINSMLDTILENQFQSAMAQITLSERTGYVSKEVAIKDLNENIDKVKKFLDHNNELKEKAEDVLKRGEGLLQKYQTTA